MMQKYRKIPEEVTAVQLTKENIDEVSSWCRGFAVKEFHPLTKDVIYVSIDIIQQFGGYMRVDEGYYIIKDSDGIFYKYNSDKFDDIYEMID